MTSPPSADRDWANLPRELLGCIAERLSVMDYISFSAVCTSWSSAASPENGLWPPLTLQRPYLLLPGEEGESSQSCTLLSLSNSLSYFIAPLPEIRGKWCVGSQHGWLVTLDEFSNPGLLNPLTRAQIHLPAITTLPNVDIVYNADGSVSEYLYRPPSDSEFFPYSLMDFRRIAIKKLVLSSSPIDGNFAAVAIFDAMKKLLFIRPGDDEWTFLELQGIIEDIIYRDGKFLVVSLRGNVHAIDLSGPSVDVTMVARGYGLSYTTRYLVDSSGVLLQVCRESMDTSVGEGESMFKTNHIEVRRLDPKPATWIPVISLGDRSLFLGTCCSMSLSSQDIPGLKGNCIYFTDDLWDILTSNEGSQMIRDVGVYNMKDGSVETFHPPDSRLKWPPPIWITPALR